MTTTATPPPHEVAREAIAFHSPSSRADRRSADRRCATCGYGIVQSTPPYRCPMCGGSGGTWVQSRAVGLA